MQRLVKLLSPDPKGEFLFEVPEYILQALQRITRTRDAQFEAAMSPLGLNVTRYRMLVAVVRAGSCTMTDLAVLIGYDRTTLARAVEHLVADGLIRRSSIKTDRRFVELSPTPEGEALYRRTIVEAERLNDQLFEGVADEQLRAMLRSLETMLGNLGEAPADIARNLGPRWA